MMDYRFLDRLASMFHEWNEWKSKQAVYDLQDCLNRGDYIGAAQAIAKLEPWISAFSRGDCEGQYYAERLMELRDAIDTKPKQLELF